MTCGEWIEMHKTVSQIKDEELGRSYQRTSNAAKEWSTINLRMNPSMPDMVLKGEFMPYGVIVPQINHD